MVRDVTSGIWAGYWTKSNKRDASQSWLWRSNLGAWWPEPDAVKS